MSVGTTACVQGNRGVLERVGMLAQGGFEEQSFECAADLLQGPDFGEDFEGKWGTNERTDVADSVWCIGLGCECVCVYVCVLKSLELEVK